MADLAIPQRYEPVSRLGRGGGGEVWAVRDRHTGGSFALKVLAEGASEREMAALVREAVALSGLEGLGVPRVIGFGRLPGSGRPYMVRELVEGRSLEQLVQQGGDSQRMLEALALAADQLTVLHRAGLLHGDVKPANIIVQPGGEATLVDLGLAAPWREGGAPAEGLTPKYAAPELFEGKPLTVRAEVYALGVTLAEIVEAIGTTLKSKVQQELDRIAQRACAEEPERRHPSADEFASALKRAAGLVARSEPVDAAATWPVVGIDTTAAQLFEAVQELAPGGALRVAGPEGSGRSALLRRLAWSLGVEGRPLAVIDDALANDTDAIAAELEAHPSPLGVIVLVDDAERLVPAAVELLLHAREAGARLVVVGGSVLGEKAREFVVPPLDEQAAIDLVRRAVPSLTEGLLKRISEVSGRRPGELRRLVRRIETEAVASAGDIERIVGSAAGDTATAAPKEPLERAMYFLDRGRYNDASAALDVVDEGEHDELAVAIARARLQIGLGDAAAALERLEGVRAAAIKRKNTKLGKLWQLFLARGKIGLGDCAEAVELSRALSRDKGVIGAEALAYLGLAECLLGQHDDAQANLDRAVHRARTAESARVEGLALASLGFALERSDRIEEAHQVYERALLAAETAGDASTLANVRLNLAGLLMVNGDVAGAIGHYEGAVDMGKRSGRRSTARQALLNLANLDLYLGRLARARSGIDTLEEQRSSLSPVMRAQLAGLRAELASRTGQTAQATRLYDACAAAYEALGRSMDTAEARLEGVLVACRAPQPDLAELRRQLTQAEQELGDGPAHRPLLLLAQARVAWAAGDEVTARSRIDAALGAARDSGQREWIWRALEARAELEQAGGQPLTARRDREEALTVLEDIGARLPRDLREVYWNDPRRRALRTSVQSQLASAPTEYLQHSPATMASPPTTGAQTSSSISSMTRTPLEARLAKLLEINSELVGELDRGLLTSRVTDHAVALLRAERGFVILESQEGDTHLTVHTSRGRSGDEPHAEFSRSIAEKVIATGEAVVSLSARDDAQMASYASVHQLMLQSVACVPIMAPSGRAIGALYVETRLRPGNHFQSELPTLRAFADQVAIAIENARLINENKQRADQLAEANAELEEAQARLKELLGHRTQKLNRARKKLRETRETLYGHFGYQGLVGTSTAMRRVYSLMERVKHTDVPVLITGESGTGKEVVAKAIHAASDRASKKFVGLNCGAIPEHLLESELFGSVRGAFTGADRERKGLFREAEGGTLLLDEIGEMPHKMQSGLLRVLQDKKVRPVGGTTEQDVDVRLIFATNRDLEKLVEQGSFREDLYYRIHVVEVRLPTLRERVEDIPQLVDYFLGLFAARYKREKKTVSREALRRLAAYEWPGNVRQLEHVLLNAWVLSEEPELEAEDLDIPDGSAAPRRGSMPPAAAPRSKRPSRRPPKSSLSQHRVDERERIIEALEACNWNRVKAAEMIGIPRRTFYRRLREYGIQ